MAGEPDGLGGKNSEASENDPESVAEIAGNIREQVRWKTGERQRGNWPYTQAAAIKMAKLIGDPNTLLGYRVKKENFEAICHPNPAAAAKDRQKRRKKAGGSRARGEEEQR
ncbi:hypothetical protein TESG_01231 [Trichophyton tonsurans CBS 112818]|uniref:Uncharacterized protein n=1 Tax=Trichophyton tonsurans (strain CBS 112818) TaxID=647933 RepID=F2RQU4_TRIT1|nr:hypothetical protein TESG_01231 [Trichophyton tonsurans CBS 112818]